MGYWVVLPYHAVRHFPLLHLAPARVVPQRDRRPRPTMDYTFHHTNQECLKLAPAQAMQFGATLQRILQRIVYCNAHHGPLLLAKVDLADGYYRVPLSPAASLALAVLIPSDTPHDTQPLVALPLALPMGWAQSPPFFCAYTETIADLTNSHPATSMHLRLHETQTHHLDLPHQLHFHPTAITLGSPTAPPISYTDVYINDFMVSTQRPHHMPTLNTLLHSIESVFHDPTPTNRRTIISTSILHKGDASFSTGKNILGWTINTHPMTLHLPEHRCHKVTQSISNILAKLRCSRKRWQELIGLLCSSSPS